MRHAPCEMTCIVIRDRWLDGQWRGWRNSRPHTGARRHNGHKQPHSYEPNGRRNKLVHPPHASAEAEYRPSPAMQKMEATSSYDLGPEGGKPQTIGSRVHAPEMGSEIASRAPRVSGVHACNHARST